MARLQFEIFHQTKSVHGHWVSQEAARAHDKALVLTKGRAAITNFNISEYQQELFNFDLTQFNNKRQKVTDDGMLPTRAASLQELTQGLLKHT